MFDSGRDQLTIARQARNEIIMICEERLKHGTRREQEQAEFLLNRLSPAIRQNFEH